MMRDPLTIRGRDDLLAPALLLALLALVPGGVTGDFRATLRCGLRAAAPRIVGGLTSAHLLRRCRARRHARGGAGWRVEAPHGVQPSMEPHQADRIETVPAPRSRRSLQDEACGAKYGQVL